MSAPAPSNRPPAIVQTRGEEIANVVTHGGGLLLALAGTAIACTAAAGAGGVTRIVSVALYCFGLVLVYAASTFFHVAGWKRWTPRSRNAWRLLDHVAIYVLIAATYTPVMLLAVGGAWGWSIVAVVWALAVAGTTMKFATIGRYDAFDKLDTALYLAMGWLCVIAIGPIWASLSGAAFLWMLAGGLFYTIGCVFFLWERLPYSHAIWHGFVLGGSAVPLLPRAPLRCPAQ